jgi:hypothetical protein
MSEKEVVDEELLKRIARYEHHLETARKTARKYYLNNKDAIRAKNRLDIKSQTKNGHSPIYQLPSVGTW